MAPSAFLGYVEARLVYCGVSSRTRLSRCTKVCPISAIACIFSSRTAISPMKCENSWRSRDRSTRLLPSRQSASHAQLAARPWRGEFGLPGRSVPFPCSFPFRLAFPSHWIVSAGSSLVAQYWSSVSCVGVTVVTPHCLLINCDLRRVADRGFGCHAD